MSRSIHFQAFFCALLCFTSFACRKQNQDTEVKTLDNFAQGADKNLHQCKGSFKPKKSHDARILLDRTKEGSSAALSCQDQGLTSAEQSQCDAVRDYLSALPNRFQDKYFDELGGSILLTSKNKDMCTLVLSDSSSPQHVAQSERTKIDSCWLYTADGLTKGNKLIIVHSTDPQLIRFNGVRVFGFLEAQFYPKLSKVDGRNSFNPFGYDTDSIRSAKDDVSRTFMNDLIAYEDAHKDKSATYSFEKIKPLTKHDNARSLVEPLRKDLDVLKDLFGAKRKDLDEKQRLVYYNRLRDYIYAESFDSFYCNAEAKALAQKDFSQTMSRFADEAKRLEGGASLSLTASSSKESIKQDSLALQDMYRWNTGSAPYYGQPQDSNPLLLFLASLAQSLNANRAFMLQQEASQADENNSLAGVANSCPNCNCNCGASGCSCCAGGQCSGGNCASCSGGNCAVCNAMT